MSPKFTIFTPTYNREYTLARVYESLLSQSDKDFEWLVVDDGSKDGTKNLIETFISENKLNIRYIFQENQGKHIAINNGLQDANGKYFLVLDSDDGLHHNCIEKCKILADKIDGKDDFAGFTFIRFSEKFPIDFDKYGKKEWVDNQSLYFWEFPGEMNFVYKTQIANRFLFPKFEGERFCPESVVHRRIARKYHILFTDSVLSFGDYLEDGLTQNYFELLKKNPRAMMLSHKEKIWDAKTFEEKIQYAKNYWDIALSYKKISFFEKFVGINPLLTARVFFAKLADKLKN